MKIRIEQDEDARSPSEDADNDIFLVANHSQFYVPEPGEKRVPDYADELIDRYRKTHWVFPIEAYIHSGVVLAFSREGNFPDRRWDVSQLGFIFVAKKVWRLSKSARKAAEALIEEWNQYLSGDVWGYIIEDDDGEELHSCWGFYGREYCEQAANEEAKSLAETQPAP